MSASMHFQTELPGGVSLSLELCGDDPEAVRVAMNDALYNLRGPLSVEETGAYDFAHVPHPETETAPMS